MLRKLVSIHEVLSRSEPGLKTRKHWVMKHKFQPNLKSRIYNFSRAIGDSFSHLRQDGWQVFLQIAVITFQKLR